MRHAVVWEPLVESLIHGLLLVAEHPYRQALAAPSEPGRPAAVRDAMDIIEGGPHLPLTISTLASHRDLRSADPFHSTVSAIAHRWGFTHLGRFAAAHKTMYGQTPLQALRAAH